jgi:hypothetical protein
MREAEQLAIDTGARSSLEDAFLRTGETASAPEGHPIHEVRVAGPATNRAMRRAMKLGRGFQR